MDIFRNLFEEFAPQNSVDTVKEEILNILKDPFAEKTSNNRYRCPCVSA